MIVAARQVLWLFVMMIPATTLNICPFPPFLMRPIYTCCPSQSDGKTYEDICAKQPDGTCELPFRGVTRFWGNERANYDVRTV